MTNAVSWLDFGHSFESVRCDNCCTSCCGGFPGVNSCWPATAVTELTLWRGLLPYRPQDPRISVDQGVSGDDPRERRPRSRHGRVAQHHKTRPHCHRSIESCRHGQYYGLLPHRPDGRRTVPVSLASGASRLSQLPQNTSDVVCAVEQNAPAMGEGWFCLSGLPDRSGSARATGFTRRTARQHFRVSPGSGAKAGNTGTGGRCVAFHVRLGQRSNQKLHAYA